MKITFKVDQAGALRRGFNAPSSTTAIDVDPAQLEQWERDLLAGVLENGHEAFGRIDDSRLPALTDPSVEGIRAALLALRDQIESTKAQREQDRAKKIAENTAACSAAKIVRVEQGVNLENDRPVKAWGKGQVTVSWPQIDVSYFDRAYVTSEVLASYEKLQSDCEALQREALELAMPELRRLRDAEIETKQAEQDEFDRLLARLPGELQERYRAGFADRETHDAVLDLIMRDMGLSAFAGDPGWRSRDHEATKLTAAEYAELKRLKAVLPDDAKIDVLRVNDYREANEGEQGDSDGEVPCDYRSVARVRFRRATIDVDVSIRLTPANA